MDDFGRSFPCSDGFSMRLSVWAGSENATLLDTCCGIGVHPIITARRLFSSQSQEPAGSIQPDRENAGNVA